MHLSCLKTLISRSQLRRGLRGDFSNAGEICLAPKRFILVGRIADQFEEQFVEVAQAIRVGDPMDPANQMGPMARADLRDSLHKQVEDSVAADARVLCGGKPKDGKGTFYKPTVLSGVTPGMETIVETRANSILEFLHGLRGELHVTLEEGTWAPGSTICCSRRCRKLWSAIRAAMPS
jgi:hypothetical protein